VSFRRETPNPDPGVSDPIEAPTRGGREKEPAGRQSGTVLEKSAAADGAKDEITTKISNDSDSVSTKVKGHLWNTPVIPQRAAPDQRQSAGGFPTWEHALVDRSAHLDLDMNPDDQPHAPTSV